MGVHFDSLVELASSIDDSYAVGESRIPNLREYLESINIGRISVEGISRRDFMGIGALSAALFALSCCNRRTGQDKYIPVTEAQQRSYDRKQEGKYDNVTAEIEVDVITAAFVDNLIGNQDGHLSCDEARFFQYFTGNKEKFYTITVGPSEGASAHDTIPYTNNPNDYLFPDKEAESKIRQPLFNEQDGIEERIRDIERQFPKYRGKLHYLGVENPPGYSRDTPFLVAAYFQNDGSTFTKKKVLGYNHTVVMAKEVKK